MKLDANSLIRVLLTKRCLTVTKLAEMISKKTGRKMSQQNLSKKLLRGSVKYDEMLEIAEILGFEIKVDEIKDWKRG